MDVANRQNTDKGTISSGDASFPVLHVFRRTAGEEGRLTAVHFIAAAASSSAESACPLAAGDAVRVSLDWGRRLDNMQQHSGQHLISALFENRHGSQPRARRYSYWGLGSPTRQQSGPHVGIILFLLLLLTKLPLLPGLACKTPATCGPV